MPGARIAGGVARGLTGASLLIPACCPTGSYLNRTQIERVADEKAAEAKGVRSDPEMLGAYINSIGGEVVPRKDAPNLVVANRSGQFLVSRFDFWSLTEAIGYMTLHHPHFDEDEGELMAVPASIGTGSPYARAKLEATWFGNAFLMPETELEALWKKHDGFLREVAAELKLPMTMVATRAYRLGFS